MSAASPSHADLRRDGETLAATLPPLLADAEHLASTMLLGEHGRRRSGTGEEFWQYRPAMASDEARLIDWRRSARCCSLTPPVLTMWALSASSA